MCIKGKKKVDFVKRNVSKKVIQLSQEVTHLKGEVIV